MASSSSAAFDIPASRRPFKRRRASNKRVAIQRRPALVVVAGGFEAAGRAVFAVAKVLAKLLVLVGLMAAVYFGGRWAVTRVVNSPKFLLEAIEVSGQQRATRDEIIATAGIGPGDRLLAIDTDEVAEKLIGHPWVGEARVSRRLPGTLVIEVVERKAAAAVSLGGGLYLLDGTGRPFKRATAAEAVDLPVITGIDRTRYVDHRLASEAAFREALTIVDAWKTNPKRPALSEINVAPRHGFTAFLTDGGAEIRLGRHEYARKLARLDQILEAVTKSGEGAGAVRVVHLDGSGGSRIPVHLQAPPTPEAQP
ncbi:MAG TPA: FtsQ-type POTRA domain-containing protein [Polyangia bacterium]